MRLVVQKYGGTSVGTPERIRNVARRLVETQREGSQVVAVISAMACVTDDLIKLPVEIWYGGNRYLYRYNPTKQIVSARVNPDGGFPDVVPANDGWTSAPPAESFFQ